MASSFGDRFAVVLLGLVLVLLASPGASSATESPVAAYSFDEGKGEIARDSYGGHDGTLDGAEWIEAGKYGAALRFDGEGDIVTIPDSGELDLTESFTLEAWVRLDQRRAWAPILTKETSGGWFGYQLYAEGGSEVPVGFVSEEDWGPYSGVPGPEPLPLETWKHLALTSDGGTMRLYVDGELEASETAMAVQASDGPLRIGGNEVFGEHLDGVVDEVRIYDRVLSGEEIEGDGEAGVGLAPRPKPIAALSFDEGKGEIARDSFGGHDGTLDGAEWIEAGKYGAALRFDGEDDLLTIPDHDELDLTEAFTLEAWVRLDQRRAWASVFTKETSGGWFGYQLYAEGGSEVPSGFVSEEDWGPYTAVAGPEPLPLEAWRHLAFSSDGQVLRLYVDGELEASETAMAVQASDGPLQIGGNEVFGEHLDGVVDEVRLYDRVLSGEEIEEDGEAGIGIRPPTRFVHDADGRLEAMIEPNGETAVYEWDAAGNLISIARHPSAELSILQLSPSRADIGESISIEGTGFSPTPGSNTVKFNGTAATVTAATATKLTVEVPEGASAGTVTVATPGEGPVTSAQSFAIAAATRPNVSSIEPTVAAAGEEVTISGSNFELGAFGNDVTVNQSWATVVEGKAGSIEFEVPGATTGGRVRVTTPNGSDLGADLYVPPSGVAASKVKATGRFALGGSTTTALGTPEAVGLKIIDGTEGQRVAYTLSESSFSGAVSLWSPRGAKLPGGETGFTTGGGEIEEAVRLPESGTYTFLIDPAGELTGSVKLSTSTVTDVTGAIVPSAEGAEEPVTISTPRQNARYSVKVKTGQEVAVQIDSPTFTGKYHLEWLTPKGTFIDSSYRNGTESGFWARHHFPHAGTYTLVVNPEGTATGSVDLTLWDASAKTGESITPTEGGQSKSFSLDVPGQATGVTFAGTAGDRVLFEFSEITFSGWAAIHTPSGSTLGAGEGSLPKGGKQVLEPVTLPATGTYTVWFESLIPNGETGSVKFTAYKPPADLTGSIVPTTEGAEKAVTLSPAQNARYSVSVEAGESVSVEATNSTFNGTYRLEWRDAEGGLVTWNSWSGTSGGFWGPQEFKSTGTYTLVVNPEGSASGSVDLELWDSTALISGSITPTEEGESETFSITAPGQVRGVTFEGVEGQEVTLEASEITFNGWVAIHTPGKTGLSGGEGALSKGGGQLLEPVALPSTGTYTIYFLANGKETGSVKFTASVDSKIARFAPLESTAQLASYVARSAPGPIPNIRPGRQVAAGQVHLARPVGNPRPEDPFVTPEMRAFRPDARATWHPPRTNRDTAGWEAGQPETPWEEVPQLYGPQGTTALAGQVLRLDGLPLAGVGVSLEGSPVSAETDRAGRFLLAEVPSGRQRLVVDGEDTGTKRRYGAYEVGVDLAARETTALDYTIWLTPLEKAGDQRIDSPTRQETRLTTTRIPGLEVRIPAGTVIRDAAGRAVKHLNISAVPVDRPPFPLPPFVSVPMYFTVQPGRTYLSKGARIVYPNWDNLPPGQRVAFWNYDSGDRGWYVYGHGTVTPDGKQVMPDPGVRVWEFTGAMITNGLKAPASAIIPGASITSGDPVDLYSGLFIYRKADLVLPDTIPLSIERTYRPGDSNSYSFGTGTASLFDMRLWSENNYKEADLILPDGSTAHYVRTSSGTSYEDSVYRSTNTPSAFYESVLEWNPEIPGYELRLTNGISFLFGEVAPLQAIRDRFGNTLTLNRESGQKGNITRVTSPNGRWAEFSYDESNRITDIVDNGGRHLKYTYASGRLTKVKGLEGRTTEYEYDEAGRMKAVINARGKKYLQVAYDANGRVEKQTAGDGAVFEFDYDLDEAGDAEAATVTDPMGNEREVTFDAEGFPISDTVAPGTELEETMSFERQPKTGLILSKTDPLERTTDYAYDKWANVTEETKLAGTEEAVTTKFAYEPGTTNLTRVTDPLGHTRKFEYGADGELVARIDGLGEETAISYSEDGQPVAIQNPEGERTELGYAQGDLVSIIDPLGRAKTRFVDGLGRVRAAFGLTGQRTLFEYNAADELTSVKAPSGAETTIEYDQNGNPISLIDPREGETTTAYDEMDRIESMTDPLERTAEWSYNDAGQLEAAKDRRGNVSAFTYDPLGRLAGASFGASGESAESTVVYEYDEASRLTDVDDSASGEYALSYDDLDRLEALEGPIGTVGYEYDLAGRRETMSASGLGTVGYEYDNANRLTEMVSGEQAVSLVYDKAGRLDDFTLPNGVEQHYAYNAAGDLTSILYGEGESAKGEIGYIYDANGLTGSIGGSYARLSLPEPLGLAEYDAANQLTERDGEELEYDADGNLVLDGSSEYSWNARGQLTGISGGSTAAFAYDPFGRRVSKTLGETTTDLLYDGANMIQESVEGSPTANLLVGLRMDQLFSRTTEAGTATFLTDRLGSVIALANSAGGVQTTYAYDPFGTSTEAGQSTDNPFQFTGRENDGTDLQFNRARYYSPAMARFISQDPAGFIGSGPNLYHYVGGAPLDFIDPTGEMELPFEVPDLLGPIDDAISGAASDSAGQVGEWVSPALGVASEAAGFIDGFARRMTPFADQIESAVDCIAEGISHPTEDLECLPETPEQPDLEDPPEPPNYPPPAPLPPTPLPSPKLGR